MLHWFLAILHIYCEQPVGTGPDRRCFHNYILQKYILLCLSCSQAQEVIVMLVPKHHLVTIPLPINISLTYWGRTPKGPLHTLGSLGTCWCAQMSCTAGKSGSHETRIGTYWSQ